MSSAPMTPLRQRMIEDMSIRQFGEKTQRGYVAVVADFARFLGRSPDRAQPEDLRRYQLHLATAGVSPAKMNAAVSALRFFFKVTLDRQGYGERLATVRKEDRLTDRADGVHIGLVELTLGDYVPMCCLAAAGRIHVALVLEELSGLGRGFDLVIEGLQRRADLLADNRTQIAQGALGSVIQTHERHSLTRGVILAHLDVSPG